MIDCALVDIADNNMMPIINDKLSPRTKQALDAIVIALPPKKVHNSNNNNWQKLTLNQNIKCLV